jgi:hypothetical protein
VLLDAPQTPVAEHLLVPGDGALLETWTMDVQAVLGELVPRQDRRHPVGPEVEDAAVGLQAERGARVRQGSQVLPPEVVAVEPRFRLAPGDALVDVGEKRPLPGVGDIVDDGDEVDVAPRRMEVGQRDRTGEVDAVNEAGHGAFEFVEVGLHHVRDNVGDVDRQRVHGAGARRAGHPPEGRCGVADFRRDTARCRRVDTDVTPCGR